MAGIVYGIPYSPPAPPVKAFTGVALTWTGWDGSMWDLTDPSAGVFLRNESVEGLGAPEWQIWTKTSPAVSGQHYRGSVVQARRVFWPLFIYHDDSSMDWVRRDQALWRTMDPDKPGIWKATLPDGSSRELSCRFESVQDDGYSIDPVRQGWAVYGIALTADKPFWLGKTISRTWQNRVPKDFFNAPGKATPYNISSGSTMASASIPNTGDEPAWPVWVIAGPSTVASVGVGDTAVPVPFTIPEGKAILLDTDPTEQIALYGDWDGETLRNPVDRTIDLGSASFAPIPAGQSVPLNISMTGAGSIRAEIRPRYRRAW
ncbi:hypothetical protein [Arthrobacter sp. RCC_34]|uniref:hypothetical protein n=1 Tax=Arthrobacter sp. RCC_34 TaxID=3239230 RepID=UPI0035258A52